MNMLNEKMAKMCVKVITTPCLLLFDPFMPRGLSISTICTSPFLYKSAWLVFSSPEQMFGVSYCDHPLSVVHPQQLIY